MRAAVLEESEGPLVLTDDVELEPPRFGELVVDVAACGVCHSDLSAIDGSFPVPLPVILGHEAAGVVTGVGPGVTSLAEGDRVVVAPSAPCGHCYFCMRGQPGVCVTTQTVATFAMPDGSSRLSRHGEVVHRGLGVAAFADQVVVEESAAVPLPDGVPLEIACLLGCGVQTGIGAVINTARVEPGATVLVVGLGGVGQAIVLGAQLAGASRVIVVDPLDERRGLAGRLGATDTIDPAVVDVVSAVHGYTGGIGVDYAFEAVGRSDLLLTCITATRPGGTVVMVGAPALDDTLVLDAPVLFGAAEKRLVGCFLGSCLPRRDVPKLLALWERGRLDLEALVTTYRPFHEVNEALADLQAGRGVRTVLRY